MLKQVSIYAENKKGTFRDITTILMQEDINILGSVTNNSTEYGVVRMIVSDTEKPSGYYSQIIICANPLLSSVWKWQIKWAASITFYRNYLMVISM